MPINSDPMFTVAATPGAVGTSRWLAPEIITPDREGRNMPVMESKPADVFAFGMFAFEVFTGDIPFKEQKNEAVVVQISRGVRPKMPANAQAVGLTTVMWEVLENCWKQKPEERLTIQKVVEHWQRPFDNGGGRSRNPSGTSNLRRLSVPPRGSFGRPDDQPRSTSIILSWHLFHVVIHRL